MTGSSGSNVDSISSIDAGNPLHLQTNDNNSGPSINLKLTGSENYKVWANAMNIALRARNKICFVDGTCIKAAYATSVPLSNQWERCNFLMGLDDVHLPIRSALFTQTELPDVKDAFVIVCREESHRGLGSGIGVQKPTIAKLMSLLGDKHGNRIHANMAANGISYNFGWKIDSGANQHITSSTNNMTDIIDILELNITVGHPNGTTAKIRKDLKKENILGTGNEAGGLYVFNTEFLSVLKNRLSIGKTTHDMPCEVCHHAKQVREHFPLSEHKSDSLGSLIHLDLWGPYKVATRDRFSQASSPNDDEGEPSGSNIGSESESDDIAKEQSSDDDQGSMQIGEKSSLRAMFITDINMFFEPKSYDEAALDKN
ncbi:ribonuclease H-like domain-containing protein [Tanacetum coccineum]